MQDALDIAEAQAREQGASRIHQLTLRVGALSGVVPDALEFAFEAVTRGSMAEGAALVLLHIPAEAWCRTCLRDFQPDEYLALCPLCQGFSGEIRRGRELELASLEVS
jgi:hydrogenase nickel incorporation protein HypA/HybF